MCNNNKVHLNRIWYKDFLYCKILGRLLLALELKKSQVRSKRFTKCCFYCKESYTSIVNWKHKVVD